MGLLLKLMNGEIENLLMKLSITVDHRVVDGMEAAKFLNTLKNYLENPISRPTAIARFTYL